jgi:hypothetical protein
MNKRANFVDIPVVLEVAFVVAFVSVFILAVFSNFNSNIQSSSFIPESSKNISSIYESRTISGFDSFFVVILAVFLIFSIVMARKIPSNSKFMLIAFFVLIFMPLAAIIISNVWDGLSQGPFLEFSSQFTIIPFVMDHLVIFTIIYVLLVAVALLTKSEWGVYLG